MLDLKPLNRQGYTLIEAIIALSLIIGGAAAAYVAMMDLNGRLETMKKKGSRESRFYDLYSMMDLNEALVKSAELLPNNQHLRTCLLGGALDACSENCCKAGVVTDLTMLDPLDALTPANTRRRLSGPSTDPVQYSQDGELCKVPEQCDFSTSSTFKATCLGGLSECDRAQYLTVELNITPLKPGVLVAQQKILNYYFVKTNSKPILAAVANQALTAGSTLDVTLNGDPGHPTEKQNLFFEKCQSSNDSIVTVTCYGFVGNEATIRLQGNTSGNAQIRIQVNDTENENNLSDELVFDVSVGS